MNIGVVPDPLSWPHFATALAWLEPARALGALPSAWEPDEALWAVMDEDECIAAVTARMVGETIEVLLVGGRDQHRWLKEVERQIADCAVHGGARRLMATGRKGWSRILPRMGWQIMGEADGMTVYVREL